MNEKEKATLIVKTLNKIYPKTPIPLKSKNTFTLLISVLLSAQCTDVNVNNVTKNIYPKYFKPEHFVKLGRKKIEKLIKKIGIFRIKAKSIYLMSKQVLEKHKGKVPKTFEELTMMTLRMLENYKYGLIPEFDLNEIYIHNNSIESKTKTYKKSISKDLKFYK